MATPYDADAINYDVIWEVLRWKLGAGSWEWEVGGAKIHHSLQL
jgi:hypothetical protein